MFSAFNANFQTDMGKPLSEDTWTALMLNQSGESPVSIRGHPPKESQKREDSPNMSPILF